MGDLNWQDVKRIFNETLALPEAEREAFLISACNEQMQKEVKSLLSFYEEDPGFLETSVNSEALRAVDAAQQNRKQGQLIGAYRLDRELGQGGMGMVYLASRIDGEFEHQVAIKLGKQDAYKEEVVARLKHERQVLASLTHPNIAQLLDGGVTEEGRPYFAMEYVEDGVPIDVFCESNGLSVEQRLRLFQSACDAVGYAHRQLVVHRDLKPSNILVTPAGQVKLLDFGLAKLLDERSTATAPITRTGLRIMTLEYASPEQVRNETISTATDVYALGVILYKLLAGRRPYEVHDLSPTQVEEVICNVEPPKPSNALQTRLLETHQKDGGAAPVYRKLEGDLDNIVMKALRKEPERRYGSVELLKDDVGRYLDELPISARPATARYRISKFVRRHRLGVSAFVVTILALVGGVISTSYQAAVASRERQTAEQRTEDVRAMANTLLFDIHDAIRDLPGATPARRLLVKNAEQYLDMLSDDMPEDPTLQHELAQAFHRVGEIQGDPHFPNLGDMAGALSYYERASALRKSLWQSDTSNADVTRAYAVALGRQAVLLSWSGENKEAINLSIEALDLLVPLYAQNKSPEVLHDMGRIRSELGWWYVFAGEVDNAKMHLKQSREEMEQLIPLKTGQINFEVDLWRVYNYEVDAYRWSGDPGLALDILAQTACPRLERQNHKYAFNPRLRASYKTCLDKLGDLYAGQSDYKNAIAHFEAALEISEQMAASDSTNTIGKKSIALLQQSLSSVYNELGRPDLAAQHMNLALPMKQDLYELDPNNGESGNSLAISLRSSCMLHAELDEFNLAFERCTKSVEVLEKAIAVDSLNGIWQSNLIESYLGLAHVYTQSSNLEEFREKRPFDKALSYYNKGIQLIEFLDTEGRAFAWPASLDSIQAVRDDVARKLKNAN